MVAWCIASVTILNFCTSITIWKGTQFHFFLNISSQLCFMFWLSFHLFPLLEHIEVNVAFATFLLFKVLCRKRNEEIVCLWVSTALFSVHYSFPHISPMNKPWTSKVAMQCEETQQKKVGIFAYLYDFNKKGRERKRKDARLIPFRIQHLMGRGVFKIEMVCNIFFPSFPPFIEKNSQLQYLL